MIDIEFQKFFTREIKNYNQLVFYQKVLDSKTPSI